MAALGNTVKLFVKQQYFSQPSVFYLSGTPPACTTLPTITTPGMLITP